jgi:hypothetical protein
MPPEPVLFLSLLLSSQVGLQWREGRLPPLLLREYRDRSMMARRKWRTSQRSGAARSREASSSASAPIDLPEPVTGRRPHRTVDTCPTGQALKALLRDGGFHHHAADCSHVPIWNEEVKRLATENSFDFIRHNMNIFIQHKVPCVQPNELSVR